jgi:uncharacterized protein
MKLQPDRSEAQTISGYGPGWIGVNGEKIASHVLIGSRGEREAWECEGYESLQDTHFARLAEMAPELVIFGSGPRIRFPRPDWLAPLIRRGIGIETMDTAAACRTYNILAGEGRHVVAALLLAQGV